MIDVNGDGKITMDEAPEVLKTPFFGTKFSMATKELT